MLELGCLFTELGESELQEVNISDPGLLAHLGALTDWSTKKVKGLMLALKGKYGSPGAQDSYFLNFSEY